MEFSLYDKNNLIFDIIGNYHPYGNGKKFIDHDNHFFSKENFLKSSRNLIIVLSDMESFSIIMGAIRCLIKKEIDSLCVISNRDIKELVIFGEHNESTVIAEKINNGSLKLFKNHEQDSISQYILNFLNNRIVN